MFISTTPYIHHHKRKRGAQEMHREKRSYQRHEKRTKQEHKREVRRSAVELTLFQQTRVPNQKVHMKQKIQGE